MTDLMWQEHPSMQAQKSAKTVFFEENTKGSSPKWGDQEDEDIRTAPLWNYNTTTEENASSSPAMSAERSNNGAHSGKDEKDPNSAESQLQKEVDRPEATPETAEKFQVFLKEKLQERQHALVPSAPNSPIRANHPASRREIIEDEVMQVDSQARE
jgi:hypothetical protein